MQVNTPNDVGAVIRDARKAKGWTQAKLAEHLGVYQKQISKYENEPGKLTVEMLVKLNAILELRWELNSRNSSQVLSGEIDF